MSTGQAETDVVIGEKHVYKFLQPKAYPKDRRPQTDTRNVSLSSWFPQMAESSVIMAYLDGLGPVYAPQATGSLRGDLEHFASGDFKNALTILCMYGGDV